MKNIKTSLFKAFTLILAGYFFSCGDNDDKNQEVNIPSSIEQVVDIFEINFGETKEIAYESNVYKFTIIDVIDKRVDCYESEYTHPDPSPELYNLIRVDAYLKVETRKSVTSFSVGRTCSTYDFEDIDVNKIWSDLDEWHSDINEFYFRSMFGWGFSDGASVKNSPFNIFLAKAAPIPWQVNHSVPKNDYQFILILTI